MLTSIPLAAVPTFFASTPNAAFLAVFDTRSSSINFHLHPHFADIKLASDDAQVAQRIGSAIALALHQGSDVQDIIKTLPLQVAAAGQGSSGNKRKRGAERASRPPPLELLRGPALTHPGADFSLLLSLVEIIEAVVAACWQTLDGSSSPETSSVGKSRWILRLVQLQHLLYRFVDPAPAPRPTLACSC